ncbi:leucine efflux protein LeuE [Thiofilum flexile]|uniref:leucine efflux protein LeuE n=1 Tax=Thiofilum flexile TaxID=125627 RepID=UPI000371212D|nr:leucine efflux protein LeuE [Thiofilum flexile]
MEQFGVLNYATYFIGCIAIILLPGPNSLYVLATAAQRGIKAGWQGALGIFVGDAILMVLTALGAVSVLTAYPLIFKAIQSVGALYLAYIGFKLVRSAIQNWNKRNLAEAIEQPLEEATNSSPFKRSLLISLLNPKAILFFLSFFVQFVDPSYDSKMVSFLILAVTLQIMSLIYLATLIYAGVYLAEAFKRRKRLSAVSTGSVGAMFMAFSAKLATASVT